MQRLKQLEDENRRLKQIVSRPEAARFDASSAASLPGGHTKAVLRPANRRDSVGPVVRHPDPCAGQPARRDRDLERVSLNRQRQPSRTIARPQQRKHVSALFATQTLRPSNTRPPAPSPVANVPSTVPSLPRRITVPLT
jgi:hypothetical protein